jgi:hypothetical protein
VSFFLRRRSAIRLPSFRLSTQFNYHLSLWLTTKLNYGFSLSSGPLPFSPFMGAL